MSPKTAFFNTGQALYSPDDIQKIPLSALLEQSEKSESISALCRNPVLDSFWINKIASLYYDQAISLLPTTYYPAFDQFNAFYFLNKAIISSTNGKPELTDPCLKKAIKHGSFHAAYLKLKQAHITESEIVNIIQSLLQFNHSTPAYLLVAEAYYTLACIYQHDEPGSAQALTWLEQTFVMLLLAQKLLPYSDQAFANATFDLKIEDLFPHFSDMDAAITFIQERISEHESIDPALLTRFYQQAKEQFIALKNDYPLLFEESPSPSLLRH